MKYIKMLGIAVLASLAVMAVAGVGTAAAGTKVCKDAACTSEYPAGTKISSSLVTGTHATLTTNLTNVTCKKSTVSGVLTGPNNGVVPAIPSGHGEITGFTFSECTATSNGSACTVSTINLNYTATAVAGPGLTVTPKTVGANPGATVVCPNALINCTFTTKHILLDVTNGGPATVHAVKEPLERSGGFCPSESFWDATYTVTTPNPLHIV